MNLTTINPVLRDFDQYPDGAHIRPATAKAILAISSATFWRLAAKKAFPLYKLSQRVTTVKVGDLRAYINSKAEVNHD